MNKKEIYFTKSFIEEIERLWEKFGSTTLREKEGLNRDILINN
jgi:hypothetical protein